MQRDRRDATIMQWVDHKAQSAMSYTLTAATEMADESGLAIVTGAGRTSSPSSRLD
jgi:hypothetical protein